MAQDWICVFAKRLLHIHVSPMMSHAHSSSSSCLHMSVPPSSLSSLSSTSTSQITLPINKYGADPQNEEYGSVAKTNSSKGYEPNQLDNQLDNFDYSETYTAIFQNESVDIDTEPSYSFDAELDDELIRKALPSPLFTQDREEPANLRQTYHSHEESLLPAQSFFTRTSTGKPVYEPSSNLSQKNKNQIATWKTKQYQDSLWKTKRANSCRSQIWDPEARTSSRVWQKKYPGIDWNYWFSANGNWSYFYRVWAITGEINYYFKKKYQDKIGIFVKLVSGICETWKKLQKSHMLKVEELSRRKLTEDSEAVTSFF